MARAQPGQTASFSPAGDVRLKADLMTAGFDVTKVDAGLSIVQDAVRCAAKLIIFGSPVTGPALFEVTKAIYALAPRPVIVFTNDPDAAKIEQSTQSGIHAYVVNGYSPARLRSVNHLAQRGSEPSSCCETNWWTSVSASPGAN